MHYRLNKGTDIGAAGRVPDFSGPGVSSQSRVFLNRRGEAYRRRKIVEGGGDGRKSATDFACFAAVGPGSLYCGRRGTRLFVGGYAAGY